MAWTASVTNKTWADGVVNVTVAYTDGTRFVTETYRSPSPKAEWIPDTVRERIIHLESADSFTIPIGTVTPSPSPAVDADESLFMRRVRLLEQVKVMIDLGVVPADNPKVVALIGWMQARLATYFDKLAG